MDNVNINNAGMTASNYTVGTNTQPDNSAENNQNPNLQLNTTTIKNTGSGLKYQPINRLNALDSSLLEESAYRNIDDEAFKTEYRIDKLESELNIITKQLISAKKINDTKKVDIMTMKKHSIENELKQLYGAYKGAGMTGKLTSGATYLVSPKKNVFERAVETTSNFISDHVLSKISKKFSSGRDLQVALEKLQHINKNVTELISNQAPYGESEEKYDQLSRYLTKANTIQYQVSRELSQKDSKIKANPFATLTSKEKSIAAEKAKKKLEEKTGMAKKTSLNLNNNLSGSK